MKKFLALSILAAASLSLTHCESTDDNDVAEAQACFNNISDSAPPAAAQACESKIAGVYTPQAYVIRCSVDFFAGGITPSQIATAYQNAQTGTSGAESAALISGLILVDPNAATPTLAYAQQTYNDCAASGVTSMIFIASIAETGTVMSVGAGGSTSAATIVSTCQSSPSSCNPTTVGNLAQNLSTGYCSSSSGTASSSMCSIINGAVSANPGNPSAIGQAIFNALQ